MELRQYQTLDEKGNVYTGANTTVNVNFEILIDELVRFREDGNFIFRGCGEAKYKLYNSAQRNWISNELFRQAEGNGAEDQRAAFTKFIEHLIFQVKEWNGQTVKKLLSAMSINEANSLAYLSFMQHYGMPSPLLDFTANPFIALYFGAVGAISSPSNTEIENYFSLYTLATNSTVSEIWRGGFDHIAVEKQSGKIPYAKVAENSLHIIDHKNPIYGISNNLNIINQEGLFVYNSDPFFPLAESIYKYNSEMIQYYNPDLENLPEPLPLMTCYNIHKSLVPQILEYLSGIGIDSKYIVPDIAKMRSVVINAAVSSYTKRR